MGGNWKQEALASSPSQAYPKPASALHLHGSDSGICVRTVYQPQAQGAPLSRDSQLDLHMLKRGGWVDTRVQAMLSSFLTN